MIKKYLLLLFLCIAQLSFSQESRNFSAMILSLNGEGIIVRDSQEEKLMIPQRFLPGDLLSVTSGNAIIMLFSGEEVSLSAISEYTVPSENTSTNSEIAKMANNTESSQSLLSQSGVAYRLRGESRVFPTKSKVLNTDNAILRLFYDNITELNPDLKIIDSKTQKVIFEKHTITDSIISLKDAPFNSGKSYYYQIQSKTSGKPELGTIVIANEIEKEKFQAYRNPQTHFEYLNAISAFYSNKYFFEAHALINRAIKKYPDYKIYHLLLNNLLTE